MQSPELINNSAAVSMVFAACKDYYTSNTHTIVKRSRSLYIS
jgi:hypothetical protein